MRQTIKGSNSGLIWDTIPEGNEENHEKTVGSWCDDGNLKLVVPRYS